MTRTTSLLQRLTLALALALAAWTSPAAAAPTPALEAVPPELKPWVPWVLAKHKYDFCTHLLWGQADIQCAWPSRLELRVDPKGGRFRQSWHMDQGGFVPLPGDKQHFPLDVQGNAGALAVVDRGDNGPFVELPAGDHTVSGNFLWDSAPDHLRIPEASGLVSVFLDGKQVPLPPRQNSGDLWLRPTNDEAPQAPQEADALSIVVHRHLADTIPLELTTRVALRVAGKPREVLLARPLPDGWTPLSLASPLPSRLEPDGRWRVQVRPGEFTLTLKARGAGPVDTIRRPTPNGPWTSEAEIWAFEAHPELRVTALEGLTALDPTQTNLPEEWSSLPAYAVPLEAPVTLSEKLRHGSNPPPDQLKLSRDYWLDFEGASYTFRDRVTGTISRGSRLDMGPQAALGRVVLNNRDRLVTKPVGSLGAGVEVPSGPLLVQAEGRVESSHGSVPAVAWNHNFQAVTGRLHLPQGYKLLHATGVDLVQGTWLQSWTLFDLFMVLVSTMAVARLYGRAWGIFALVMLSLSFQEEGAPQSLWLFFLAFEAITRVLPMGRVQTASVWARGFFFLLLTVNALPFLLAHLRHGLYPALDPVSALPGYARVTPEMLLEGGKQEPAILRVPAPPSHWPKLLNREEYGSDAEALRPVPLGHAQPSKEAKAMGDDAEAHPGQSTEQTMDLSESAGRPPEVALNKAMVLQGAPSSLASPAPSQAQALDLLDARAKVQTGPGIPSWNGHLHFWQFHGPVNKGQEMRFIVLTPTMNLVLAMVQTVLLLALLLRLFPWRNFPSWWRSQAMATASLTALLFLVLPSNALAQTVGNLKPHTPELSLLDQLEQRLLTQHECHPSCASAGRLSLRVDAHTIHARLEVDATITGAVPLPGHREHWLPSVVLVDGKPATALRIHDDGHLWVGVSAGRHQLVVEGPLPERTSVQLGLPLMPHKVLFESKAWTLKGVHEDGAIDEALELVYAPTEAETETETDTDHAPGQPATLRAAPLPPLLRVERTLTLGMDWSVETHVVRMSPTGSPARLEVALLPGEAVTTSDILVRQGRVEVSLLPDATEVSWKSSIAAATDLSLIATEDPVAVEEWTLLSSPTWHVDSKGIPFQSEPRNGGLRAQTWHPWPGEKVSLKITRPEMTEGASLTLDRALYTFYPGIRSSEGTVEMNLRSSQGTTHALTLPEGAELVELRTGDVVQPLRQDGRRVPIAVTPGANYAFLKFRVPVGLSTALRVPAIDLGAPAVNVETQVQGLGDRWLVYLHGPRLGPAILYWSLLLVLAVLAGILSRAKPLPLGALGWFALTIGLSQVGWASGAVVVGWFVVMDLRGRFGHNGGSPLGFNARQGALVLWTYWALSTLLDAVKAGLLGKPDMQLAGNGSTVETLTWFQDRVAAVPESPLVISCPMLVYRGLMLLWALWLAWALLHWVRWAWTCFSQGGLWRPLRKPRGAPSRDEIEPTETPTPEPQG